MTQELQLPVANVFSIEFSATPDPAWLVEIAGGVSLVCSLIAANLETFYVSCEDFIGDCLPDYVEPMERNAQNNPL